jgi:hypothetical protein
MSAPRTFDYEYLKTYVRDHPGLSHGEYAAAVTAHEREVRNDPGYGPILQNTITAALGRMRPAWEEQGIRVPRSKDSRRKIPWTGLTQEQLMSTPLRKLKILADLKAGGYGSGDRQKVSLALRYENRLNERKLVVDLKPSGIVYDRPARPDELDGTGELLSYYARYPGLTSAEWRRMTPEERAQASRVWLAGAA